MIAQIGRLGEASFATGITSALCYFLGSVLGAAASGAVLGLVGWVVLAWLLAMRPPGYHALGICAVAAAAGGLVDLGVLPFRLPQLAKQVPRGWLTVFGPRRAAFFWGLGIGSGTQTMAQYASYYVLVTAALLFARPSFGALLFACYGAAQAALVLLEAGISAAAPGRASRVRLGGRSDALFAAGGSALLAWGVLTLLGGALTRGG